MYHHYFGDSYTTFVTAEVSSSGKYFKTDLKAALFNFSLKV